MNKQKTWATKEIIINYVLIRHDSFQTITRFTLPYHKLYLHITQFNSVLFVSTENRRTRSFSSIDLSFTVDMIVTAIILNIVSPEHLIFTYYISVRDYSNVSRGTCKETTRNAFNLKSKTYLYIRAVVPPTVRRRYKPWRPDPSRRRSSGRRPQRHVTGSSVQWSQQFHLACPLVGYRTLLKSEIHYWNTHTMEI